MTAVTYSALRSLTTGHTEGVPYQFRLMCIAIEHPGDVLRNEQRALGGRGESLFWRNKRRWQIATAALRGGELDQAREFLESVVGGEPFTFDEFGFVDQPHLPVSVVLAGGYRETRAIQQGDGGADDYFRFAFTVREA